MSTTRLGRALPASTPPAPNRISFRSSVVETMVKTVSQWAIAVLSVTHLGADLGERIGLRRGPVPDRELVAGLDQAGGHGFAHAAEPDPADVVRRFAHYDETSEAPFAFLVAPQFGRGCTLLSMSLRLPARCAWLLLAVGARRRAAATCPTARCPRHLAGRYAGALSDSTAVPTVIRDRGIKVPDAASPCRCSSSCGHSWPRAIPAAPMPASPTISPGQHAAARLGRADAECLGAEGERAAEKHSDCAGAAGARSDRLSAAAGRHLPAAAGARRRASWRRSGRRCRSWRSAGVRSRCASSSASIRRTMSTCRPSSRR